METDYLPVPMPNCERGRALTGLGLTVEAASVPWSKSRNAGDKHPSLNWHVRVLHNGREVIATDYSAGMAHAPAYNAKPPGVWRSVDGYAALVRECETGRKVRGIVWERGEPILPNALDVLHSLALDSSAINCASFEEWASEYGFDTDSRKAEGIYRACLEIGLKLRATLGDTGLATLRATLEDY